MKSVYSAVRTGSLDKAICALSVKVLRFDKVLALVSEIRVLHLKGSEYARWFTLALGKGREVEER